MLYHSALDKLLKIVFFYLSSINDLTSRLELEKSGYRHRALDDNENNLFCLYFIFVLENCFCFQEKKILAYIIKLQIRASRNLEVSHDGNSIKEIFSP